MSVMWSMEFLLVILANLVVDSNSFHSYAANPFKAENFAPSLSAEKADKVMTEFQEKTDDKLNELEDEIKNSQSLAESKITILETEMKKLANDTKSAVDSQLSSIRKVMDKRENDTKSAVDSQLSSVRKVMDKIANDTKSAVDSQLSSVRKVMDKIAEVCPNPSSLKGGKVLKSTGRHVGAQVQFQCTDGEKLAFTCLATGEWGAKSQCSQTYWENPPLGAYKLPSTFGPGSAVTFIAEPLGTGHMWSIFDFKKNGDDKADILLHTSIRTKIRSIVRNSRQNGHYGREERAHLSPFDIKVGQPFNFTAVLDKIGYKGYVNGDHYFDFKHRVKEMPQYVALRGQMKVNSMKVRI